MIASASKLIQPFAKLYDREGWSTSISPHGHIVNQFFAKGLRHPTIHTERRDGRAIVLTWIVDPRANVYKFHSLDNRPAVDRLDGRFVWYVGGWSVYPELTDPNTPPASYLKLNAKFEKMFPNWRRGEWSASEWQDAVMLSP